MRQNTDEKNSLFSMLGSGRRSAAAPTPATYEYNSTSGVRFSRFLLPLARTSDNCWNRAEVCISSFIPLRYRYMQERTSVKLAATAWRVQKVASRCEDFLFHRCNQISEWFQLHS